MIVSSCFLTFCATYPQFRSGPVFVSSFPLFPVPTCACVCSLSIGTLFVLTLSIGVSACTDNAMDHCMFYHSLVHKGWELTLTMWALLLMFTPLGVLPTLSWKVIWWPLCTESGWIMICWRSPAGSCVTDSVLASFFQQPSLARPWPPFLWASLSDHAGRFLSTLLTFGREMSLLDSWMFIPLTYVQISRFRWVGISLTESTVVS